MASLPITRGDSSRVATKLLPWALSPALNAVPLGSAPNQALPAPYRPKNQKPKMTVRIALQGDGVIRATVI